ncbi:MAG: Flp pilus assembly protein CpaB [Selenomonadaceae bacterium]
MNTPRFSKKIVEKLQQLTPRQLVGAALVISTLVAALIYFYLASMTKDTAKQQAQNFSNVVVATVDIPERSEIREEMLKLVPVARELVAPGAAVTVEEVTGSISRIKIMQGDVLTDKKLYKDPKMAGFVGMIPSDSRAISIPITDATGISGLAKPGDYVDVMLISNKEYKNSVSGEMLLQNVLLLGINKSSEPSEGNGGSGEKDKLKTATLAVRPEEAVRLATAQAGGVLYLAMRPVKPANGYALIPEILISCGGAAPQPASIQFTAPAPVSTPYYTGPVNTGTGVQPAGAFLHNISVIRGNSVSAVQVK